MSKHVSRFTVDDIQRILARADTFAEKWREVWNQSATVCAMLNDVVGPEDFPEASVGHYTMEAVCKRWPGESYSHGTLAGDLAAWGYHRGRRAVYAESK